MKNFEKNNLSSITKLILINQQMCPATIHYKAFHNLMSTLVFFLILWMFFIPIQYFISIH